MCAALMPGYHFVLSWNIALFVPAVVFAVENYLALLNLHGRVYICNGLFTN